MPSNLSFLLVKVSCSAEQTLIQEIPWSIKLQPTYLLSQSEIHNIRNDKSNNKSK